MDLAVFCAAIEPTPVLGPTVAGLTTRWVAWASLWLSLALIIA